MAEKDKDIMAISHSNSNDDFDLKSLDSDAQKLAEMGYSQDLRRNYSVLSVLGVGFSLTNSWFGISAALVTGINSGGPILIVYGIILIALISTCVGISLSELASAYPNAGTYQPTLLSYPKPLFLTRTHRRPVLLGQRACAEKVRQLCVLSDWLVRLGWQHLYFGQRRPCSR